MIRCEALTRSYPSGGRMLTVLKDITLSVEAGAYVAITGPSGSGKTTLLGLLAGLDLPSAGSVMLDGVRLDTLTEDQPARLRGERVGVAGRLLIVKVRPGMMASGSGNLWHPASRCSLTAVNDGQDTHRHCQTQVRCLVREV